MVNHIVIFLKKVEYINFSFPFLSQNAWLPILILRHILLENNILNCYIICCSVTKSCSTLCNPLDCNTPCSSVLHYLLQFAQINVHWVGNAIHLILCSPFLLLPSIFPNIGVFSSESALGIGWPEYWSFSISPSSEYSGLISFRIDWFDLLEVANGIVLFLGYFNRRFPEVHCLCSKKQFQLVDNKCTIKKCRIIIWNKTSSYFIPWLKPFPTPFCVYSSVLYETLIILW